MAYHVPGGNITMLLKIPNHHLSNRGSGRGRAACYGDNRIKALLIIAFVIAFITAIAGKAGNYSA